LAISHVVNLLKYVSEIDITHQDVLIRLFFLSLETRQKDWVEHTLHPKSISSLEIFIEEFLKRWAQEQKVMKTLSTISWWPSKGKDYVLSLLRKMKNPLMNKKLKRRFMKRDTNPSKRSKNYLMIPLETTKI
jgi:hypothetical protein